MTEESKNMSTAAATPIVDEPPQLAGCALVFAGNALEAADALTVGGALEPALLEAARDGLDPFELEALVDALEARRTDSLAFVRAGWALQRRIAELTANPVLRNVYLATLDIAEARLEDAVPGPAFLPHSLETVQRWRAFVAAIAGGPDVDR